MEILTWVLIGVGGIIALVIVAKFIKGCITKLILVGFLLALVVFLVYILLFGR